MTPVGILIPERLTLPEKAKEPSEVSELGNDTLVRPVQKANAPFR